MKEVEKPTRTSSQPFNGQYLCHIKTSQLICRANQLTGFFVRGTLTVKGLKSLKIICDIFVSAFR